MTIWELMVMRNPTTMSRRHLLPLLEWYSNTFDEYIFSIAIKTSGFGTRNNETADFFHFN